MRVRKLVVFAIVSGVAMMLGACGIFHGGGWTYSLEGVDGERVTFGVNGTCENTLDGAMVDLDFTFHDHGYPKGEVYNQNAPQKKHFAIFSEDAFGAAVGEIFDGITCNQLAQLWQIYVQPIGDQVPEELQPFFSEGGFIWGYCPQGADSDSDPGACGFLFLGLEDTGDTGPDKGDTISVLLLGGAYGNYFFSNEIEGGNITVETFDPF